MEAWIKAWLILFLLAVVYFAVIRTESAIRDPSKEIKDVGKGIAQVVSLVITIIAGIGLLVTVVCLILLGIQQLFK